MKKLSLLSLIILSAFTFSACSAPSHKSSTTRHSSSKVVKKHKKKAHKNPKNKSQRKQVAPQQQQTQNPPQQQSGQQSTQSSDNSQPEAWRYQQQARNQAAQNGGPVSEDQARAMLGGANGDLQATRTSNGWTFSGNGYTATVNDDGSISHN